MRLSARLFGVVVLFASLMFAQQPIGGEYQPKFPGDPAKSNEEAVALGYMRVVVNAEKNYTRKHGGAYAPTLSALVGQGSFTKRMVDPNRGDYKAKYRAKNKGNEKGYELWMTPEQFSPTHRAFYVDEKGTIRADAEKQASAESPSVKD
jgi:hypothetical protein